MYIQYELVVTFEQVLTQIFPALTVCFLSVSLSRVVCCVGLLCHVVMNQSGEYSTRAGAAGQSDVSGPEP